MNLLRSPHARTWPAALTPHPSPHPFTSPHVPSAIWASEVRQPRQLPPALLSHVSWPVPSSPTGLSSQLHNGAIREGVSSRGCYGPWKQVVPALLELTSDDVAPPAPKLSWLPNSKTRNNPTTGTPTLLTSPPPCLPSRQPTFLTVPQALQPNPATHPQGPTFGTPSAPGFAMARVQALSHAQGRSQGGLSCIQVPGYHGD